MILETRPEHWHDEAECRSAATALARRPGLDGALIELRGPLGAGKTTFARHLLRALGVDGLVKSPTYALVEPYAVRLDGQPSTVWHCDFYRFDDAQEWEDAGLRDIFAGPGLKLVEWPEKAAAKLPAADLALQIEPGEGPSRAVEWQALTARGVELLR